MDIMEFGAIDELVEGVTDTMNLDPSKRHYFESQRPITPFGIVPDGSEVDFTAPHRQS